MTDEERSNTKDHIYLRLCRLAVQTKMLSTEIDKCPLDSPKLKAILEDLEAVLLLSDIIREDGRRLNVEPSRREDGRTD